MQATTSQNEATRRRPEPTELDLLCAETLTVRRADVDEVRRRPDDRMLTELVCVERFYVAASNPYGSRCPITTADRKKLAYWIYQVCEESGCDVNVLPLAMNMVDRYLCQRSSTQLSQFQPIGAVCLFIASKLRDCALCECLSASKLVEYTDGGSTGPELLQWERVVLQTLKWDVAAVTPCDFVDLILCRLPNVDADRSRRESIRRLTQTYIVVCSIDFQFMMCPPSMIAAACLRAAVLRVVGTDPSLMEEIDGILTHLTATDAEALRTCQEQIIRSTSSLYADVLDGEFKSGDVASASMTPTDITEISLVDVFRG